MSENIEPKAKLSASRIGVLEKCTWQYYAKYCLKIPDKGNDGSSRGWIAHLILENLGDRDHKTRHSYYKILRKTQDIENIPSIMRLIYKHAKRLGVYTPENIEEIKSCILAGINFDFYGESLGKGWSIYTELEFDYVVNEGGKYYRAKGFIDRLFLSPDGTEAVIRDYKTSKEVYKGKEITNNYQHLIYSLAVRRMFPMVKKSVSQFLFLKHDCSTLQSKGVINIHLDDDDILEGFEYELTAYQLFVDNFSQISAVTGFACDKPYPSDKTFGGPLICGRAKFPGQKKKDGNIMWHCPVKFEVEYFQIIDKRTQKLVDTCFHCDKTEYMKRYPHEDYLFNLTVYAGCYKYRS